MSSRGITLLMLAAVLIAPIGCIVEDPDAELTFAEVDYLTEDVIDLKTIVFQAAENAYLGEPVDFNDIVEEAAPNNGYAVTYDLPFQARLGLGTGNGRVVLRIFEDGVAHDDPLAFTFGDSTAAVVRIEYDIRYQGETFNGRETDLDFLVTATVIQGATMDVEYLVDGDCFLGATFCRYVALFRSEGEPRNGVDDNFGDGTGFIDDPDVFSAMDFKATYIDSLRFGVSGTLAEGAAYSQVFFYDEVL